MSRRRLRRHSRQPPDSLGTSYDAMMEEEEEEEDDMLQETEDEEELERSGDIQRNQLHLLQERITHRRGTVRENKFSRNPYLPERVPWRLTYFALWDVLISAVLWTKMRSVLTRAIFCR